jgi:uncharacterized protein YcfJ
MKKTALFVFILLGLGACATVPNGPSVLVLQGSTKTFEEFRRDEIVCRDYALQQIGGKTVGKTNDETTLKNAAIGTVVGTVAGAAIGQSDGAAVGAGLGLLFGTAAGAENGRQARTDSQTMYDNAFIQCMYGSGHRVPMSSSSMPSQERSNVQKPSNSSTTNTTPPPPPPPAPPSGK